MAIKREPKQSQLDYLWVNFGERGVVTSTDSENSDAIPSFKVVQDYFNKLSALGVGSVTKEKGGIEVRAIDGSYMNTIVLPELGETNNITKFSRRIITQKDIDNGSPYLLLQPVYSIILENGYEFVAPIDVYEGNIGDLIETKVVKNTIYTDLKIDKKIQGVEFITTDKGLAGKIHLEGSTKGINFSLLSQDEYDIIPHDSTTLYIIQDANYIYFGNNKIGTSIEVENKLESFRQEVNQKFEEINNKQKEFERILQEIDGLEDLEELKRKVDNIINCLTWEEILE